MTEKEQKQKEILMNEKELHTTSQYLKTTNEKFDEVLDYVPIDNNSIQVGKVMLKRSSRAHAEALKKLVKIREQKKIETTMYKIHGSLTQHITI